MEHFDCKMWLSFQASMSSNKVMYMLVNSLWPRDAIWHQISWSTQVQVMACCLTAPSYYLNHCWLVISEFFAIIWRQFHRKCSRYHLYKFEITNTIWQLHLPVDKELIWFMLHCGGCVVSLVAADALVPIWHQGICSHHGDIIRFAHVSSTPW